MKPFLHSSELDIIKTIAIILVICFHYFGQLSGWHITVVESSWLFEFFQNFNWLKLLQFIEGYFYLGVNLFIIASGFGLYLSQAKKEINWKDFFQRRIVRLLPAALLVTFLMFLVKGLALQDWRIEHWYWNLFPFLGGINLFKDEWFFPPINGELWFLGLIIQLYLFFPLLFRMLKKLGERKFLLVLFCVTVIFRTVYYVFWQDSGSTALSYGLSIGRLFEFGFGMVFAQKILKGKKMSPWWSLGILLFPGYFFGVTYPFSDALLGTGLFTILWLLFTKKEQAEGVVSILVKENVENRKNLKTIETVKKNTQSLSQTQKKKNIFTMIAEQSYMMFLIHHPFIWIVQIYWIKEKWSIEGFLAFLGLLVFVFYLARFLNWTLCFKMKKLKKHSLRA